MVEYPVIDLRSTGARINELRRERGITVDELRIYLGMNNPNSIYKWFRGEVLPTLENMYALLLFSTLNDASLFTLKGTICA